MMNGPLSGRIRRESPPPVDPDEWRPVSIDEGDYRYRWRDWSVRLRLVDRCRWGWCVERGDVRIRGSARTLHAAREGCLAAISRR